MYCKLKPGSLISHQTHPIRSSPIERQVLVGLDEVVVTSDLDRSIAGTRHAQTHCASALVDRDRTALGHDELSRSDVNFRVGFRVQSLGLKFNWLRLYFVKLTKYSFSYQFDCLMELLQWRHRKETSIQGEVEVTVRPADWSVNRDEFRSISKRGFNLDFAHHRLDAGLHLVRP